MSPLVSIIVPTIGRPASLRRCLGSIEATVEHPHEIVCVTVRSDEATQELLADHPGVRNEVDDERTGFVRAANRGFEAARGAYVVQLNDDCLLMPHTIENAINYLGAPAHADVGQAAFFHDSPVSRNIEREITVEGIRYAVCHVRGLCFANFGMVRREVGERLGWYDERFRMYGADPDFSLRVWHELGMRVSPCAGALVRHAQLEDERGADERAAQGEDNARLFEKWGAPECSRSGARPAPATG